MPAWCGSERRRRSLRTNWNKPYGTPARPRQGSGWRRFARRHGWREWNTSRHWWRASLPATGAGASGEQVGRQYPLRNGTHSRARGGPDWVADGVRAGSAGGVAVLATLEGSGRPVVRGHELLARVSGARVVGLFRVGAARSARPDHAPTKLVGRERDAARAPDAGDRPGW